MQPSILLKKVFGCIMDEARDKVLFKKFILHSHALYECTIYSSYSDKPGVHLLACGFPPQFNNLLYYSYMKWWMNALWNLTNTVLGSIDSSVGSPFALSWLSQIPALAWTGPCQSCPSIWAVCRKPVFLEIHGFTSMGVVHGFYFTIPYQKTQYQQELTYFQ